LLPTLANHYVTERHSDEQEGAQDSREEEFLLEEEDEELDPDYAVDIDGNTQYQYKRKEIRSVFKNTHLYIFLIR